MSLPTDLDLPLKENYENEQDYLKDVVFEVQDMYDNIVQSVNGFIRNSAEVDQAKWTPTLAGTVTPGTFTYTQQYGWSIRQGIFTQLHFDVRFTATTATGNLYLELPYKVTLSQGLPFVGPVQSSVLSYGAGYTNIVVNATPNTYRGNFWLTGSGAATTPLAIPAGTVRLIGSISYIGIEDE